MVMMKVMMMVVRAPIATMNMKRRKRNTTCMTQVAVKTVIQLLQLLQVCCAVL